MSDGIATKSDISLWDCLHDGTLESIFSDLFARTVALVIDVSFHWEFNGLSRNTRFRISLAEVLSTSALTFFPWPGRQTDLTAAQYEQALKESGKGRLQSVQWDKTVVQIEKDADYLIYGATLTKDRSGSFTLRLQGTLETKGDYYELLIEARQVQFFIGQGEVSLEDFVTFGGRYWEAFATKQ